MFGCLRFRVQGLELELKCQTNVHMLSTCSRHAAQGNENTKWTWSFPVLMAVGRKGIIQLEK